MSFFRFLQWAVLSLSSVLGAMSALVIALISVVVTYNVIQRMTFGDTIHGIVDLSALALVIVAFGGIAQAEVTETHVRLSLFADRMKPKARKITFLLSQFVIGALAFVTMLASYERAMGSLLVNETQTAQKYVPIWSIRFFIVLGLATLLAVCIEKFVRILRDGPAAPEALNADSEAGQNLG